MAEAALPEEYVAKGGSITYLNPTPTYADEQLEFTELTLSNIVVSTNQWS